LKNIKGTAHLIHGFVGVGKTTFARRLERELPAVRFTHDEWMHKLYGPNPPADQFDDLFRGVDELIWQYATRILDLDRDIVLDYGFWTRESRDQARSRIAALGAGAVLYNVKCPESEMERRVSQRTQNVPPDSLWINQAAINLFKERFQPLDPDEKHIEIDGNTKQDTFTEYY